jgi:hypothetical protein
VRQFQSVQRRLALGAGRCGKGNHKVHGAIVSHRRCQNRAGRRRAPATIGP